MSPGQSAGPEVERITSALIKLVAEGGYRTITVEQVVERAGVERDAFDRHFASKEDCYLAIWEETNLKFVEIISPAFASGNWRASIGELALLILDFIREFPEESRFQFEARNAGPRARARLEAQIDVFVELVDRGRQELADPDSLSRATAEGVAAAVFEQISIRMNRSARENLSRLVPELMFIVLQPYLGIDEAMKELRGEGVERIEE
jgi:AcrR family transcriptional regulator